MDLFDEHDENEIFDDGENLELSNEGIQANEEENEDANDNQEDEGKRVKPKKIIRHPRAKLNAELLKGPKGLGNLEKCFDRVQFKGKGYEEQDLNVLLKTYEYWCHRLFPKFPFKDCIDKIEKLGSKGPIQTHLKKVRSGMIDDDIETMDVLPDFNSDEEEESAPPNVAQTSIQATMADIPIELTEDQLETIRRNREKAQKLRQERLRKIQEKAAVNLPEKNVLNGGSTSIRRSSTEMEETEVDIQSNTGPGKNVSSESDCNGSDPNMHCDKSKEDERVNLQEQEKDENNDSDEEFQISKKNSKKFFDDDDEEESTTVVGEIGNNEDNSVQVKSRNFLETGDENIPENIDETVEQMEVDE